MFLGDRERRRNGGGGRRAAGGGGRGAGGQPGAGSAVPRAARTERPAAARSRTAPHRATQRRTWPGCELELKGPAGPRAEQVAAEWAPGSRPPPCGENPHALAEPG